MSTDREAAVWYGWIICIEDLWKLCEFREAVTHEEKRYDPKTGLEVEPEEVVDEESGHYWHGELISGWYDICAVVGEWLKKQDMGFDIAAMQWDDGSFEQLIIGKDVDDSPPAYLSYTFEQGKFVHKHFTVDGLPRIAAFMFVG